MALKMIRYTVKPDRVQENEDLVRAVYAELHRSEPEGVRCEEQPAFAELREIGAFRLFEEGASQTRTLAQ
jgi:hypothetical protein